LKRLTDFCLEMELLHCETDERVSAILHIVDNTKIAPGLLNEFASSLQFIDSVLIKEKHHFRSVSADRNLPVFQQEFDRSICGEPFVLSWGPGCFSQINVQQNRRLVRLVCQLGDDVRGQRVLDLFCGMGNFSIPLGLCGASVIGIEHNPESITWAGHNAETAGLKTFTFQENDAGTGIRRLVKTHAHVDCVLLDPPRQGLGKATSLLANLGPGRIIYISCDPATLMRDLRILTSRGYTLISLTPIDMFPQTHHIESAALLEKN